MNKYTKTFWDSNKAKKLHPHGKPRTEQKQHGNIAYFREWITFVKNCKECEAEILDEDWDYNKVKTSVQCDNCRCISNFPNKRKDFERRTSFTFEKPETNTNINNNNTEINKMATYKELFDAKYIETLDNNIADKTMVMEDITKAIALMDEEWKNNKDKDAYYVSKGYTTKTGTETIKKNGEEVEVDVVIARMPKGDEIKDDNEARFKDARRKIGRANKVAKINAWGKSKGLSQKDDDFSTLEEAYGHMEDIQFMNAEIDAIKELKKVVNTLAGLKSKTKAKIKVQPSSIGKALDKRNDIISGRDGLKLSEYYLADCLGILKK